MLPSGPSHHIGVVAFLINDNEEVLVVKRNVLVVARACGNCQLFTLTLHFYSPFFPNQYHFLEDCLSDVLPDRFNVLGNGCFSGLDTWTEIQAFQLEYVFLFWQFPPPTGFFNKVSAVVGWLVFTF
ncbi:uncharacterized protein LOC111434069 [Cucurbita moschata]|uniref:Uncharacterized protein LOC111434069 n=1 Tax=Cucurbita moschata TaxID=3662 RepID=A0A6J1EGA2_CUCMO|nr:uncharacterized protein LOC111434069 [Cucurbita moschata]